jgi:hypothetical protein
MSDVVPFIEATTLNGWIWVLNAGAVYRLSRLVARDAIFERPRNHIEKTYHGMLVTLMTCMWCLSFWFGLIAVGLTLWDVTRPWWMIAAVVLTLSTIAGLLGEVA